MINIDRPIETAEDDFLGRSKFAKDLAKSISSYNSKESLVLGLMGQWGSGKTSIINLVEKEMQKSGENTDYDKIITIKFQPWNIADQDNLVSQFFATTNYKLEKPDIRGVLKKTGAVINIAADTTEFVGNLPVPFVSDIAKSLSSLLKDYTKVLTGLVDDKSLTEIKKGIETQLLSIDGKLLFIIDDIDRLSIKEIAQIFQLVKAVADFPNTIYLLSFDRTTVIEALEKGHVTDGSQYLEKIIQIPFEVPMAPVYKVKEKFKEEVLKIRKNDKLSEYFQETLEAVIYPFLVDARKMYRLLSLYRFKYGSIGGEVNDIDLLNICAIEIFNPGLYVWIKKYKDILTANTNVNYRYDWDEGEINVYATKLEKFLDFSSLNNEINKEIIRNLFPNSYFFEQNKMEAEAKNEHDFRMHMERETRIGCPKYFDRYFTHSLETNELIKKELEYLINEAQKQEVVDIIDNDNKKTDDYLDYIICRIAYPKFKRERAIELIGIVLELGSGHLQKSELKRGDCETSDLVGTGLITRRHKVKRIIYELLENIEDQDERFSILQQELKASKPPMLKIFEILLDELQFEYGGKGGVGLLKDKPLLKLEDIDRLEEELIAK
ncbi:KAP family P-loop NTPase fold protein [Acetobacterium wieringae]|uniref:KAP family P-loop NTPase fold protein n=1 Tax=Acetobacterium wieringae TaxID=52694 RepID=UPI0031598020